jgi:excisionase family DNA binding protein
MGRRVLLHSKRSAAVLLGVSERTLHTLIARGALKVRRIGRRVLVADRELSRFAALPSAIRNKQ